MRINTKLTNQMRLAGVTVLLGLSTFVTRADYSNTVGSFGPVGYWRFNETASAPALNKVTNASTMGSVLDGYVILDAAKGQPGRIGNSIRFTNSGVAAGYCGAKVDVPYSAALNKAGAFSVECWVKPADLGTDATGMAVFSSMMNDFAAASRTGYLLYLSAAGRFEFRLGNQGGYIGTLITPNNPAYNATVGNWRYVVCVFDGATNRVYVDGVNATNLTLSAANIAALRQNSQSSFRISGTPFNGTLSDYPAISAGGVSGNRGVDAWVDEVAYYSYALSGSQIAARFAAASVSDAAYRASVLADSPVGYWPMDEGAVTAPSPASYPTLANSGSAGISANGTLVWGGLSAQNGNGYSGMGAGDKSVFLDGANGYVKVGTSAGLDFTGQITMMAWVKPTAKNFFRDIIARGWDGANAETFLRISRGGANSGYGSTNFYEVGTTDQGVTVYSSAGFRMPEGDIGNWVHIAGTYDGSAWTLYRNGQPVATVTTANGALITTNDWTIGAQANADIGGDFSVPGGISTFFPGNIDEPAIFNTALSAANILAIYNSAEVAPVITRSVATPNGFLHSTWPTLFKGGSATLSVWAEGVPTLGFQWYSNGIPLGVTATNLNLVNMQVGTPTYSVVVTNAYGSATSSVTLTIIAAPPSVTTQPVPLYRTVGDEFIFSIATAGSVPQTYQWRREGVNISGANSLSYTGIASLANGGGYSCVASNEAGLATSSVAPLTVFAVPSGFGGEALADSPIAYWRLGETNGSTAYDIVGYNNGTYFAATLGESGYSVIDPNKAASFSGVNSYVGQISGTPGSGINFEGTTASFTIEVWANGAEGQNDEASLVAKGTGAEGTTGNEQFGLDVAFGKYRFFTRGNNNTIYSAEATEGPNGTWQHVVGVYDQSNPSNPQMRIYVNGVQQGSGGGRPEDLGGLRTSSALVSIGSKRLGNSPNYDGTFNGKVDEVIIYDTAMSASDVETHYGAAYGPSLPPSITVQPKSLTNYAGLNATFTVSAIGTVPLTYQWKKNGFDIGGATSQSYSIAGLTAGDIGNYTCAITNVNGFVISAVASLSVLPAPTSPPAIPGLVMHHTFNSTLVDSTGRGNNGVAVGQTHNSSNVISATYTAGKLGNALSYSSDFGAPTPVAGQTTTTNTSWVTLGVRPDLQFTNTVNFTVAFWIKLPINFIGGDLPFFTATPGSLGGQGFVFSPAYGYGNGSGSDPATDPLNFGGWGVSLYNAGSAAGSRIYGDLGGINDGEWHHLVFVFTRNQQAIIYQNGTNSKSFKISGTSTAAADTVDTGQAAAIGQDPTGIYAETGAGEIDDLGVWKKALTPLEAASIYAAALNGHSFTDAPFSLGIAPVGNNVQLTWDVGMLQQATSITGPWTNVGGAVLSPLTVVPSGNKYYRIKL